MTTVRGFVKNAQREVAAGNLLPLRAAELLTQLAALLGSCAEEIRAADHEYALVLLQYYESEETANRAKIRAETTEQYLRKREARDTQGIVIEMIRSLKYYLKTQQEEMRLTR